MNPANARVIVSAGYISLHLRFASVSSVRVLSAESTKIFDRVSVTMYTLHVIIIARNGNEGNTVANALSQLTFSSVICIFNCTLIAWSSECTRKIIRTPMHNATNTKQLYYATKIFSSPVAKSRTVIRNKKKYWCPIMQCILICSERLKICLILSLERRIILFFTLQIVEQREFYGDISCWWWQSL